MQVSSYHFSPHILLSESKLSRKYIKTAKIQRKTVTFLQGGKLCEAPFIIYIYIYIINNKQYI